MLIDLLKATLLGIIEGLTEFIPVSSTAHLVISSHLIDFTQIQNNLFEIVIQFGAILAICVIYKDKIFKVISNIKEKEQQKFSLNIILAFLPAAILGLAFHKFIKEHLFSNLVIAIALIIGAIIMIIAEKLPKTNQTESVENITPKQALLIGFFQSIAMIPGTSRSGATIIGAMFLGLSRKAAAEFSFFLAIPTIAAASFYDLYKNFHALNYDNLILILIGLISSFISALFVIKWFIKYVSSNNFIPFAIYRIIVGVIILIFIA